MSKVADSLDGQELLLAIHADAELVSLVRTAGTSSAGFLLDHRAQDNFTPSDYWAELVRQVHRLVCVPDATEYEDVRKQAREASKAARSLGLPILTAAIAKSIGLEQALVTPFVALALYTMLRVGVTAWCQSMNLPNVEVEEVGNSQ